VAADTPNDRLIGGRVRLTGVEKFVADSKKTTAALGQLDKAIQQVAETGAKFPDVLQQLRAGTAARPTPSRASAAALRAGRQAIAAQQGAGAGAGAFRSGVFAGGNLGGLRVFAGLPIQLTAATAAALGLATAIGKVVQSAAELGEVTNAIRAFGGATQQQVAAITETSIGLSRQFGITAADAATAGRELIKAGAPIEQVNASLEKQVVILNQVSQGEITTAEGAQLVTQVMNTFSKSGLTAADTVNILTAGVQHSTATFSDFQTQFKTLAPVMGLLGFTAQDTGAILEVLNNAGLRGSLAGTSMRNAMLSLLHPTAAARDIMEKYQISLHKANGENVTARELVQQLHNAFGDQAISEGKLTKATRDRAIATLFGERSVLSAIVLSTAGMDKLDEAYAHQKESAEDLANTLNQNLGKQLEILGAQFAAAGLAIGSEFERSLVGIATTFNQLFQSIDLTPFTNFGKAINDILNGTNAFAAQLATSLGPGLISIGNIVGTTVDTFLKITGAIVPWKGLGDVIIGFAAGWSQIMVGFSVGVEMVSELLVGLAKQFESWRDSVGEALGLTSERLQGFGKLIGSMFTSINLGDVNAAISSALDTVVNAFSTVFGQIIDLEIDFVKNVINFFDQMSSGVINTVKDLWQGLLDFSAVAIKGLIEIITSILPGFNAVEEGQNNFNKFFSDAWNNVVQFVKDRVNDIINIIRGLATALSGLDIPAFQAIGQAIESGANAAQAAADSVIGAGKAIATAAIDSSNLLDQTWQRTIQAGANAIRTAGTTIAGIYTDFTRRVAERQAKLAEDVAAFMKKAQENIKKAQEAPTKGRPPGGPTVEDTGAPLDIPPGKGHKEAKDTLAEIRAQIMALLSDIPGITKELVDFLATIAKDFPERLAPMVGAVRATKDQLLQLQLVKRDILQTDLALIQSERRLTELGAQQHKVELEQAQATIGFDKQLLGLKFQQLVIDRQEWPIKDAIEKIDRRISKLQEENLQLAIQRTEAEIALIPLKARLVNLDEQEARLNQRNFAQEREVLDLNLQSLDVKNQIADIEEHINKLVDKRAQLMSRRSEIHAQIDVNNIQKQADDVSTALDEAWSKFNIPDILRLEKQRTDINKTLEDAQKKLKGIQDEQEANNQQTELASIELELQKVALEEMLDPLTKRIEAIDRTTERQKILDDITKLGLDEQRDAIEKLMKPMQDKIAAIDREVDAEKLRNQLVVQHLEIEKRALEDQLEPLEENRKAIERITEEVNFLRAQASLEFEERKIEIQGMIIQEELRKAALEETRQKQADMFQELIMGYIESLKNSKAFSLEEAGEVAKRLKMWDEQVAKIMENRLEFERLAGAAELAAKAIDSIDKNPTITITTIHKDVFQSSDQGAPDTGGGGSNVPVMQRGGIVPGWVGQPKLILAHGGERVLTIAQARRLEAIAARENTVMRQHTVTYNYTNTFDIDPHYSEVQTPTQLTDDMRMLLVMTRR